MVPRRVMEWNHLDKFAAMPDFLSAIGPPIQGTTVLHQPKGRRERTDPWLFAP